MDSVEGAEHGAGRYDLTGSRFGKLTVTGDSGKRRGNSVLWHCRCDCGGEVLAVRHQLTSGALLDCGCVPKTPRPRVTDLIGQRFGKLTVIEDSGKRSGSGSILWCCRCDCGGEVLLQRHQLVSGNILSCGCEPKACARRGQVEDLTGRRFGELTVLYRTENDKSGRVCWRCLCNCGRETTVQAMRLKNGHTRSCGCKRYKPSPQQRDLTGQRFGRLTALYPVGQDGARTRLYWHCLCDCGNEIDVLPGSLLRGMTRSCGCWNDEQRARIHEHMHFQDDTSLERLRRVAAEADRNKAGFRGLYLTESGKYRVIISFQKVHYTLGYYATFEEAVQVRLAAEDTLQGGYMRAFDAYERKAEADPAWAAGHPFYYRVSRKDGEFQISTNGLDPPLSL